MYLVTENDIGSGLKIVNTPGAVGAKVSADLGYGLSLNGNAIDMAYPKPSGAIQIVKTALTGIATAQVHTTQRGSAITAYAWSGTGVTFASPSAQVTAYSVIAAGTYTISLTVTNDKGETETYTRIVKHARIIEVVGQNSEQAYFGTLQSAHDWINTNDAANASLYDVYVDGPTADTAAVTISLNLSIIFRSAQTCLTQGIISAQAGRLNLFGISPRTAVTISPPAGVACIQLTNGNVSVSNLILSAASATDPVTDQTAGSGTLTLVQCQISQGVIRGTSSGSLSILFCNINNIAANCYMIKYTGTPRSLLIRDSYLLGGNVVWDGSTNTAQIIIVNCYIEVSSTPTENSMFRIRGQLIALGQAGIKNSTIRLIGVAGNTAHGLFIEITNALTVPFQITDSTIFHESSVAGPSSVITYATSSLTQLRVANCVLSRESAAQPAIASVNAYATLVASNWLNAQIFNCSIRGTIQAGLTYAATGLSGSNITF